MKKINLLVLILLLCVTNYSCKQAGDAVIEALLRKEADAFNKTGGKMIDEETRMDSIGIKAGRKAIYYYTLVNYTRKQIDTNVFKQALEPQIKESVRTNADMKDLRDKNVDFYYSYYDKKGRYTCSINVKPMDYNKK